MPGGLQQSPSPCPAPNPRAPAQALCQGTPTPGTTGTHLCPLPGHRQSSAVTNPSPKLPSRTTVARDEDTRLPIAAFMQMPERSGCESPMWAAARSTPGPPSTPPRDPAPLQNTSAPRGMNPGVTVPGQPWESLCPTAGYKHPLHMGKLRQGGAVGNLGALAPPKQLAFRHPMEPQCKVITYQAQEEEEEEGRAISVDAKGSSGLGRQQPHPKHKATPSLPAAAAASSSSPSPLPSHVN